MTAIKADEEDITTVQDVEEELESHSAREEIFKALLEKNQEIVDKINALTTQEHPSLVIDYDYLLDNPDTCDKYFLLNNPEFVKNVRLLGGAAAQIYMEYHPDDETLEFETRVRISDPQLTRPLKRINTFNINKVVVSTATINSASEKKSTIITPFSACSNCNFEDERTGARKCPNCGESGTFRLKISRSKLTDYQVLEIQESSNKDTSALPVSFTLKLYGSDLVGRFQPGDNIRFSGVVKLEKVEGPQTTTQQQTDVEFSQDILFDLVIEALYVEKIGKETEENQQDKLSKKDIDYIRKIRADNTDRSLTELLVSQFASHIYGNELIKEILLTQLAANSMFHVLMVGAPSCLTKGTKILMADGTFKSIEQLGSKHLEPIEIDIVVNPEGDVSKARVFHKFFREPVIEIITESGKSLTGTYNHPLMTKTRSWQRMDDLKIGEKLQIMNVDNMPHVRRKPTTATNFSLDSVSKYGPKYKGEIPQYYNEQFLSLLGYLVGDGGINSDGYTTLFTIQQNEIEDLEHHLLYFCKNLFGIYPKKYVRFSKSKIYNGIEIFPKNPTYYYELNSKQICNWLSFLKQKHNERSIPNFVFELDNVDLGIFLSWLYSADGSVRGIGQRGNNCISFKSSSIQLVRDIQQLLLRFKISSRIHSHCNKEGHVGYNLSIRKFADMIKFYEHIGFVIRRKQKKLEKLVEICESKLPYVSKESKTHEKIISIEYKSEFQEVFDIEVPSHHSFIANGILSHNTGKTQMARFAVKISPIGMFSAGKGSSGVGLTAATIPDKSGVMKLAVGPVVLCDGGLVGVDELDKIPINDQYYLLESMEDGTFEVHKGGINATLNARTSITACANPITGHYDEYKNLIDNVKIPVPLLTRFDLIYILKDKPDKAVDTKIVSHIGKVFSRMSQKHADPQHQQELDFLRKYFKYVHTVLPPTEDITSEVTELMEEYYPKLRQSGVDTNTTTVTPRQAYGLYTIAVARSRMLLKTKVEKEDMERAIEIMTEVMGGAGVDVTTGKVDIGIMYKTPLKKLSDKLKMMEVINALTKGGSDPAPRGLIIESLVKDAAMPEFKAEELFRKFYEEGMVMEPKAGYFILNRD